jgi:hypothetical protein
MADNKQSRVLNTEEEISNAIKGIKAIKREARDALQALKDLEYAKKAGSYNE